MTVAEPTLVRGANRGSDFRPDDDHYPTPLQAIDPLMRAIVLPHRVWEPACGEGHISRAMEARGHEVVSTTLTDRGYGETGIDFLSESKLRAPAIVTNPPFSLDDEFVRHALDLQPDVAAFFLRLKYLCGARRYGLIHGPNPPALVLVFIERIKFFAGDTAEADQPGWNTEDFAWFVWLKGFRGFPSVIWLSRDDGTQMDFLNGGYRP